MLSAPTLLIVLVHRQYGSLCTSPLSDLLIVLWDFDLEYVQGLRNVCLFKIMLHEVDNIWICSNRPIGACDGYGRGWYCSTVQGMFLIGSCRLSWFPSFLRRDTGELDSFWLSREQVQPALDGRLSDSHVETVPFLIVSRPWIWSEVMTELLLVQSADWMMDLRLCWQHSFFLLVALWCAANAF